MAVRIASMLKQMAGKEGTYFLLESIDASYEKKDGTTVSVQSILRELETSGGTAGKDGKSISIKDGKITNDDTSKTVKFTLTDGTTEWPVAVPYGKDGKGITVKSNTKTNGVTTLILNDGTQDYTITVNDGEKGKDGDSVTYVSQKRNAADNGIELVLHDSKTDKDITINIPDGAEGKDGNSISIKSNTKANGKTTVVLTDGKDASKDSTIEILDGESLTIVKNERIDTNNDSKTDATKITFSDGTVITIPDGADGATGAGAGDMLTTDYDADGAVKAAKGIKAYITSVLEGYIAKDGTKQLSDENFTNALKTKLEGIDLTNYVEKDGSKVLSSNDFTDTLKSKLEGITYDSTKTYITSDLVDGTTIKYENGKLVSAVDGKVKDVKLDGTSTLNAQGEAILYSPKIKINDTTTISSTNGVIDLSGQSFVSGSGEANIINGIKVNNVELTPDSDKKVSITVFEPTTNGDGTKYLNDKGTYTTVTSGEMNKIEKIKINNVEQVITDKTVNITLPDHDGDIDDLWNELDNYVANDSNYQNVKTRAEKIVYNGNGKTFLANDGTYKTISIDAPVEGVKIKTTAGESDVVNATDKIATIDLTGYVGKDEIADVIDNTNSASTDKVASIKAIADYVANQNKFKIDGSAASTTVKVGALNTNTDIGSYSWQEILSAMLFGATTTKALSSSDVANPTIDLKNKKITFQLPVGNGIQSISAASDLKSKITASGLNISNASIDSNGIVTIILGDTTGITNGTYPISIDAGAFTATGDDIVYSGSTSSSSINFSVTIQLTETEKPTITSSYDRATKTITVNVTNANGSGYTTDISGFTCTPSASISSINKTKLPIKIVLGSIDGNIDFTMNGIKNVGDNTICIGEKTMDAHTLKVQHTLTEIPQPSVTLSVDDANKKATMSVVVPQNNHPSYYTVTNKLSSSVKVLSSDGSDVTTSCTITNTSVDCSALSAGTYTIKIPAGSVIYTVNDANGIYYKTTNSPKSNAEQTENITITAQSADDAYWNQFGNVIAHSSKEEGPTPGSTAVTKYNSQFMADEVANYGMDAVEAMAEDGKYEMYYIGCPENKEDFGTKYYIPYANYKDFDTDPRIDFDALHNLHDGGIFSGSYSEYYWFFDEKGNIDVEGAMAFGANKLHFTYIIVKLA